MSTEYKTFYFPYCKECELILFRFEKRLTQHGLSHREYATGGFEEETDFECNDADLWGIDCPDCGSECDATIELPIDLADTIAQSLKEQSEPAAGIHLDHKFVEDFDPMKAKEILFESLL